MTGSQTCSSPCRNFLLVGKDDFTRNTLGVPTGNSGTPPPISIPAASWVQTLALAALALAPTVNSIDKLCQ